MSKSTVIKYGVKTLLWGGFNFFWISLWGIVFAWLLWKSWQFRVFRYPEQSVDFPAENFGEVLHHLYHFWTEKLSLSGFQMGLIIIIAPFLMAFLAKVTHSFLFSFLKEKGFFSLFVHALSDLVKTKRFIIPYIISLILVFATYLFLTGNVRDILEVVIVVLFLSGFWLIPFGIWSEKAQNPDIKHNSNWWYPVWPGFQSVLIVVLISVSLFLLSRINDVWGDIVSFIISFFCVVVIRHKIDFRTFGRFLTNRKTYNAFLYALVFWFYSLIVLLFFSIPVIITVFVDAYVIPAWVGGLHVSGQTMPWWGLGYLNLSEATKNGAIFPVYFFLFILSALYFGRYVSLLLDHFEIFSSNKDDD